MNFVKLMYRRQPSLIQFFPMSSGVMARHCKQSFENCVKYDRLFYDQELIALKSLQITVFKRFKFKNTQKDEESEEELSDEDDDDDVDSKLIVGHVISLRTDAILKAGLGMARNKVETCFYESKIRVNGRKIQKKSHKVKVGDEIDIIRGQNPMNESLLNISRVVLVSVKEIEDGERLKIKMKRYKNMTVEEYSEQ